MNIKKNDDGTFTIVADKRTMMDIMFACWVAADDEIERQEKYERSEEQKEKWSGIGDDIENIVVR